MNLDLRTLAFTLSLTCLTQVIALAMQYFENKTYRGIGWWLLGAIAMASGFIALALGPVPSIGVVALFGNPLLILGRVCIFVGTLRFLGRRENTWAVVLPFFALVATYYYFLLLRDNISARTVIVSGAIALYSLLTAHALFNRAHRHFSGSARFTALVFLVHGGYLLAVIFKTLASGPMHVYTDFSPIQTATFIVPTITSILWTFGFILMVNQRLSAENLEEKENLQRVFNTGPDAALITRLEDGSFVDANHQFTAISGYSLEEIREQTDLGVKFWEDPADLQRFVAELRDKGFAGNREAVFRRKDGTTFTGLISARTLTISGSPHVISVTRDITEPRRMEVEKQQLETRNRQLQKAESLGRMAGAIAHHFNNQLQSVMGNLELMHEPTGKTDAAICLTRAKQAAERAAEVSRLMLVYLGQTSPEMAPCLLSELCQGALPVLRAGLPDTACLEVECPSPGPVVQGDASQIQQLLTNLVTNAWEALGASRGTARLSLTACQAEAIPIAHRFPVGWQPREPDYACLEVRDTGCGIPSENLETLFDPFYSTKFTGRGLGLPVVLGIVQAHGGGIVVESRLGEGSSFRVYFPISTATMAPPPQAGPRGASAAWQGTLLLVDDDGFLLESTGAMVELMGFTLLTARDGVEALEVFQQHREDIRCVITDLTMPRMDGWETLTALRQLQPTLPVILASGYDKGQVMAGARAERPQAFLSKPFGLRQLREAVDQALGSARKEGN